MLRRWCGRGETSNPIGNSYLMHTAQLLSTTTLSCR
jgi:hypothetical protein